MNSPSKVRSARMTHKHRRIVLLLAAVAVGLCLLMALPALWLVVTGQGQVLVAGEEPEAHRAMSSESNAYDVEGGGNVDVRRGYNSIGHDGDSSSFSTPSAFGHDEDEDSRPVGHGISSEHDEDHQDHHEGDAHIDSSHRTSSGDDGAYGGGGDKGGGVVIPMSKSGKKSLWDDVNVADLKRRQTNTFTKYALTGFRNKATTDARILTQFLLSIAPRPQQCAIFDVGANIGKYVEELKSMPVARSCEIHAFEPNPDVFAIMERRVRSLPRVFLNNKGVADEPGNLTFYYQPGKADTGGSFNPDHSFNALQGTGRMKTANVDVVTLDDYMRANIESKMVIPLVKIDVEGLEYRVKKGMENALRAGRVQAVYWERKGSLKLEPFQDEVEYMASRGYYVYIMGCSGARKHNCRLTMVRIDGVYFNDIFDPKNHRAPGGGKFMTMNVLGVQRDHPFNDKIVKTMLATGL